MKSQMIAALCSAMLLALVGNASADLFQDGADRLTALQNNDGGWDWPLDDLTPTGGSMSNTIGPIGMGLAKAYSITGDANHLAALTKVKSYLLAKTNKFAISDGILAAELDKVFGGTTCSAHVKTNFYDKLEAGTYQRSGDATIYTTASFINRICNTTRVGVQANMAAWDIGLGLYSAQAVGASTGGWVSGVETEVNELDGDKNYDVVGLAGAILGLSSVGVTFDPTAGQHAAAGSLQDLGTILAGYQISNGGFAYNMNAVSTGNDSVQETAYALLALKELDATGFASEISDAADYLANVQLATGGWASSASSTSENNEITGEALWACSAVPEPSTLVLLGMAVLGMLAYARRR